MPIYNLIEYRTNYSETTGSLWFYSKDGANNFNVDIANTDEFKSFEYESKLLKTTVADGANGILRNGTIAVPLKYLSNFWRSLKMALINFKVEVKLKWTKYCIFSAAGLDNVNGNVSDNDIIFTIKDIKIILVTLSARDNQKLSKLLGKGFERSVYWNEYNRKGETKTTTNEYRYFLESNFVGVNRLFVLLYLNRDNDVKQFKNGRYYLPKITKINQKLQCHHQ